MAMDHRKMCVLAAVVDEYILTGEPVGSHAVLARLGIRVSSATIRNDMAALERDGFLEQPHTSAGRVPSFMGYRYYIEHLMNPKPLSVREQRLIDDMLVQDVSADAVMENAADVLSELTQLAVVSKSSLPVFSVITRVEVIPAGRRLYALLIITSTGTVKNKICRMEFDLTNEQLDFFAAFINRHLHGVNLDRFDAAAMDQLALALGSYMISLSPLLQALCDMTQEMSQANVQLRGEGMLVPSGVSAEDVLSLMARRSELDELLSSAFNGISVVFGKENASLAVTNSSMILSPYRMKDTTVGALGVIGPMRVDYAKVIPHIDYITKSVDRLLSQVMEPDDRKDETP